MLCTVAIMWVWGKKAFSMICLLGRLGRLASRMTSWMLISTVGIELVDLCKGIRVALHGSTVFRSLGQLCIGVELVHFSKCILVTLSRGLGFGLIMTGGMIDLLLSLVEGFLTHGHGTVKVTLEGVRDGCVVVGTSSLVARVGVAVHGLSVVVLMVLVVNRGMSRVFGSKSWAGNTPRGPMALFMRPTEGARTTERSQCGGFFKSEKRSLFGLRRLDVSLSSREQAAARKEGAMRLAPHLREGGFRGSCGTLPMGTRRAGWLGMDPRIGWGSRAPKGGRPSGLGRCAGRE
ncbi:hypothetical protein B0O80DRAFT_294640, partial [Mortierella sp. GBAus27b]